MDFEFPREKLEINFICNGDSTVEITFNGKLLDRQLPVVLTNFKDSNTLTIKFSKNNPADTKSCAVLDYFKINGGDFNEWFKDLQYKVDKSNHPDAVDNIKNDGYFGYIGELSIEFEQCKDLLKQAAWIIADKEFEYVKWPLGGEIYRTKDFNTVQGDAQYMFTGCHPPPTKEILDVIDNMDIKSVRFPLDVGKDRLAIESWMSDSKRIQINGLDKFNRFVVANGVTACLNSYINMDHETIYMPKKMFYFNGKLLEHKKKKIKDIFEDKLLPNSDVIFEYPSPWYTTESINEKIAQAHELGCRITLDLTWLPVMDETIDVDLNNIDEVYFSMNKAWPINDLRPAFRWSNHKHNDHLDFQMDYCSYPKVNVQVFMKLLEKVNIDYTYDKYKADAESIRKTFNLEKTNILWFTKHKDHKHDPQCHISDHYFLDDFVCVRKLLQHKNKYFW